MTRSVTLPTGLIPSSRQLATLANRVLVPASNSPMPDWLAYLQGRALGFADAWAETTPYRTDEYVHYGQTIYRAVVDNDGVQPGSIEDGGNIWTMVLDATLGPPQEGLDTADIDARIVLLRPNPYTTADKNKVAGMEDGSTADQTGDEIARLLESLTGDTRLNYTALRNLPAALTGAEIVALLEALTGTGRLNHSALDGVPRYKWRSDHSGTATYYKGDVVINGGQFYLCATDGHRSTVGPNGDSTNWHPLRDFRGNWRAAWYEPGNMVVDGGLLYVCTTAVDNRVGRPGSNPGRWTLINSAFRGNWQSRGVRYHRGQVVWHANHLWMCRTNDHASTTGPNGDTDNWDPITLYRGNWSRNYYEPGDMVTDLADENVYICVSDTVVGDRSSPSNDQSHWRRLSNFTGAELDARIATWARVNNPSGTVPQERLGTGTSGATTYLRGDGAWTTFPADHEYPQTAWASGITHLAGTAVRHNNAFWVAIADTSEEPSPTATDWRLLIDGNVSLDADIDARIAGWAKANDPSGTVPQERLGTGTYNVNSYLNGDGEWQDLPNAIDARVAYWAETDNTDKLPDHKIPEGPIDLRIATWARANEPSGRIPLETLGAGVPDHRFYLKGNGIWTTLAPDVDVRIPLWARRFNRSGHVPPEIMGANDPSEETYLRGDGQWLVPPASDISTLDVAPGRGNNVQDWLTELINRPHFRGTYNYFARYWQGDTVLWNGRLYRAKNAAANAERLETPRSGSTAWLEVNTENDLYPPDVWSDRTIYQAGAVLRHDNGFWKALQTTNAEPGKDDRAWESIINGNGSEPRDIDVRIASWARSVGPTGTAPPARLGTGARDGSGFLRDDGLWVPLPVSDWALSGNTDLIPDGKLPLPKYRGDYNAAISSTYRQGDVVHVSGALYRANHNDPSTRSWPAVNSHWQMMGPYFGEWTPRYYSEGSIVKQNGEFFITDGQVTTWTRPDNGGTWHRINQLALSEVDRRVEEWARAGSALLVPLSKLGAGTADTSVFLRGDGQWAAPPAGTSGGDGEANVQANWNESNSGSDAYIRNKPYIPPTPEVWARQGQTLPIPAEKLVNAPGEANVQVNWNATNPNSDQFILNKPTVLSQSDVDARIAPWARAGQSAPTGSGGEINVQSDWDESNANADAYILNKPTVLSQSDVDARIAPWARAGQSAPVSGEYNVQANWNETDSGSDAFIENKPTVLNESDVDARIAPWARAGQAAPSGAGEVNVQVDWDESDVNSDAYILNKPTLFSGDYNDLSNRPTLFSGEYADLNGRPSIPAAQVNSDWNATSGLAEILNKPTLFSGDYDDLSNKPTIPTIPAGVAATSELGRHDITVNHTGSSYVGNTTSADASDHVYTVIPATGRIRISVNHPKCRGSVEVPAAALRVAREDDRIGRILATGGGFQFVGFYCDDSNRLLMRQDISPGFSNCRTIVEHIDDGFTF